MTVRVSGFRELRRAIRKLDPELRNELWKEMSADTRQLRNELRAEAPISDKKTRGTLRKNIRTKLKKGELFAAVTIGKEAYYWRFVERGTSNPLRPPHPFIRPVWDANKDKLNANLEDAIKRFIDKPPK